MNCVLFSKIYFSLLLEGKSLDIWISEKSRGKVFSDSRLSLAREFIPVMTQASP